MDAREHHIHMKYLLARMAIQNPKRFFDTFGPGGDAMYLADLWTAMAQNVPEDQRVPSAGTVAWHQPPGAGPEIIVLTLPTPAADNEAYLIAVVRSPAIGCRVFCLERASMPSTGEAFTVVSELTRNGRFNWGPGGAPVADAFAAKVSGVAADNSARPAAFVPMPLS